MFRSLRIRGIPEILATSLLLTWGGVVPREALAQGSPSDDPIDSSVLLRLGMEAAVGGLAHFGLDPRTQDVPPSGLDPSTIKLAWDRDSIRPPDLTSYDASNISGAAALLYPAGVSLLAPQGPGAGNARVRGLLMETESLLLAFGTTTLLKVAVSRPRPYTYLDEADLPPDNSKYDPSDNHAFVSFPSGHTSTAFAAATSGIAFLALERPDLPWGVQMGNGMVGGGLAMVTGLLRIDSTQHFPTDVLVGSLVGIASGTAGALLDGERTGSESDTRNAILAGAAGAGLGIVIAFLFTPPTSPWVGD